MKITRTLAGVGAVAAAAVILSGCSGSTPTDSGSKAAHEPGSLTVYTSEVLTYSQAIDPAFTKATGNQVVTAPRVVAGDLLQRVDSEMQAGGVKADVLDIADHTIWVAHPEWFLDLDKVGLKNYDAYPDSGKWKDKCVDLTESVGGFVYNTDLVDKAHAPKTWEDLLDPYWKGHVIMTDPRASAPYMAWAISMQQTFGTEYLEKLADQQPALSDSASPAAQQVAAGAYWVNVMGHASNSSDLIKQGAPLKFVVGNKPAAGSGGACLGIFKGTKNLQAAKDYVDFMMKKSTAAVGCTGAAVGSPWGKVDGCLTLPSGFKFPALDQKTGGFAGVADAALVSKVETALKLK